MRSVMNAHCFNHRETAATKKCGCCLKPICDECAQAYQEVVVCSEQCLGRVKLEAERAAERAREEAEKVAAKARADTERGSLIAEEEEFFEDLDQTISAYKILSWVAVGAVLFFAWDYLPPVITGNVEMLYGKISSAF